MSLPLSLISARRPEVLIQRMQPVAWYDHADTATLFQDAAGTTPTTLNLPIGLRRDKSGRDNHAVQSSAPARPVLSARRNMLLATETFASASWLKLAEGTGVAPVVTDNYGLAPDGTLTAARLVLDLGATPATARSRLFQSGGSTVTTNRNSVWTRTTDASTKTICMTGGNTDDNKFTVTGDWQQLIPPATLVGVWAQVQIGLSGLFGSSSTADLLIWHPQVERGPAATRYQRVTTATDYDAQGFPLKCDFDTVDDALVTTFAAPLGSNCTIARAIPSIGAQILTGQTIGTTFTDTTDSHGLLIFDRPLTAPETAAVTRWCAGRAGL